jgi:hypothetical protein
MLKESCVDIFDSISCNAAALFCENELSAPIYYSGMILEDQATIHIY